LSFLLQIDKQIPLELQVCHVGGRLLAGAQRAGAPRATGASLGSRVRSHNTWKSKGETRIDGAGELDGKSNIIYTTVERKETKNTFLESGE